MRSKWGLVVVMMLVLACLPMVARAQNDGTAVLLPEVGDSALVVALFGLLGTAGAINRVMEIGVKPVIDWFVPNVPENADARMRVTVGVAVLIGVGFALVRHVNIYGEVTWLADTLGQVVTGATMGLGSEGIYWFIRLFRALKVGATEKAVG